MTAGAGGCHPAGARRLRHLTANAGEEVAEARRTHHPVAVAATAGMFAVGWALIELGWAPALA